MKDKILIAGGYGKVGSKIAQFLVKFYPEKIIVAGRNLNKAEKFSTQLNRSVIPRFLDVNDNHIPSDIFEDVHYVIMCLDLKNTMFVETCFKNKVNYIDITATYEIIEKIQNLNGIAQENGITAVLSVGLAPGITNLLTKHTQAQFDLTSRSDIFIMIGSGEKHGKEAINWTLENMNKSFEVFENGEVKEVKTFRENKVMDFPEGFGKRKFYRFSFSDQMVIPETLNIASVSTWMCLDSKLLTSTLSLFKSTYQFRLIRKFFSYFFRKFSFLSDIFVLKVVTEGEKNGKIKKYSSYIKGNNEGTMTAMVASAVAILLSQSHYSNGIFHTEQLFTIQDILKIIKGKVEFKFVE